MAGFLSKIFTPKDYSERGKKVISVHKGKQTTYQKYLDINPVVAQKYLSFIGKHPGAVYIRWDQAKERFTM